MHAGNIDGTGKAARLYRELMKRPGEWIAADDLQEAIGARTAISTYISEVRHLTGLPAGVTIEHRDEPTGHYRDRLHYYRIMMPVEAGASSSDGARSGVEGPRRTGRPDETQSNDPGEVPVPGARPGRPASLVWCCPEGSLFPEGPVRRMP